jgi:hypothetical protein
MNRERAREMDPNGDITALGYQYSHSIPLIQQFDGTGSDSVPKSRTAFAVRLSEFPSGVQNAQPPFVQFQIGLQK